jgi:hypothetical protein
MEFLIVILIVLLIVVWTKTSSRFRDLEERFAQERRSSDEQISNLTQSAHPSATTGGPWEHVADFASDADGGADCDFGILHLVALSGAGVFVGGGDSGGGSDAVRIGAVDGGGGVGFAGAGSLSHGARAEDRGSAVAKFFDCGTGFLAMLEY